MHNADKTVKIQDRVWAKRKECLFGVTTSNTDLTYMHTQLPTRIYSVVKYLTCLNLAIIQNKSHYYVMHNCRVGLLRTIPFCVEITAELITVLCSAS